jgi:hypothetical protein
LLHLNELNRLYSNPLPLILPLITILTIYYSNCSTKKVSELEKSKKLAKKSRKVKKGVDKWSNI